MKMHINRRKLFTNLRTSLFFVLVQVLAVMFSPHIQQLFSKVIDYRNLFHLLFVFLVVIPYTSIFTYLLPRPKVDANLYSIKKEFLVFSKIDIVICILLILIAIATFYKFSSYPLPVGYDTPIYLGGAKVFVEKGIKCLDLSRLLLYRGIYTTLLGFILLIIRDEIILGKFLWLQITLIIVANYVLISRITNSKITGFISSLIWIFWKRTSRLLWDLHSNTFGIFLLLLSYFVLMYAINKKSKKVLFVFIILLFNIWFIHRLTFIVGFITFLSFLIIDVYFYRNSVILQILKIDNPILKKVFKLIALSSPLLLFLFSYITIKGLRLAPLLSYAARDLLRKWWPEIPIWNINKFVSHLGGWIVFLLAECGALYLLLYSHKNAFYNLLFIHLTASLLMNQNFLFGLHALPERFAVYSFMPIYSSLGIYFISKKAKSFVKIVRIKVIFKQTCYIIKGKIFGEVFPILLLGILLTFIMPAQFEAIDRYKPTITIEEYNAMVYLRDNFLCFVEIGRSHLVVLPRWGLEYWIKAVMADCLKAVDVRVMQKPTLKILQVYLDKYDTIYLFNLKVKYFETIADSPFFRSITIRYSNITIQIISKNDL